MSNHRLLCTAIIAFAVISPTIADVISHKDVGIFPVVKDEDVDTSTLRERLEPDNDALKTGVGMATTALDSYKNILEATAKTVGKAATYLPIVGAIAGIALDLFALMESPPNPVDALVKYVDGENIKLRQEHGFALIKNEMVNVMDALAVLNSSNTEDYASAFGNMKESITRILGAGMMNNEFHLQEYSAYVVPKLYTLAPISAAVSEHFAEKKISNANACMFNAVIKQYFHPFLLDRLSRIKFEKHGSVYDVYNKNLAAVRAGFLKKFDENVANESTVDIGCSLTEEVDSGMILEDTISNKKYRCQSETDVENYLRFVRNVIETMFRDMYKTVSSTCEKPLQPLGELFFSKWFL